ncbi:MAG: MBL fold metallo-hydrolase [Hyphomicrobiales bacterium]
MAEGFFIKFWGTRGSVPAPGPATRVHGGDTSCIEVRIGNRIIVLDAGTGIRRLAHQLVAQPVESIDLLFTHCHYDHIIGLPFFLPIFAHTPPVTLWSGHLHGRMSTREIVAEFMRPPFFPVGPDVFDAQTVYRDFRPGDTLTPFEGATIETGALNHTDGAVGYRVMSGGRALAYITDHEVGKKSADQTVLRLVRDADLAIFDTTYTPAEYPSFAGWGHSDWGAAVEICRKAGVKRLALFHHRPRRTDEQLAQIEAEAKAAFPTAFVAFDDLEFTL